MNGITIYPKPNLKKKIKELAEKEGRSFNNFILFTLNNLFKVKEDDEPQKPKKIKNKKRK